MASDLFESVKRFVKRQIDAAVKALPVPRDGKDAEVDQEALAASILSQIRIPKDGIDGKSVDIDDIKPFLDTALAQWALDFERRAQDVFAAAIERIPRPKDGVDGLGFDDLTVEYDGERAISLRFIRGEMVREFQLTMPIVLDRGVYKDDGEYAQGDGVTWAGSFWIKQRPGQGKPDSADGLWRLAVKRGRDGKS